MNNITQKESKKRFSIGGKIIKDLGFNLPNMFVALNELIKNSYDACANNVSIAYSSEKSSLIIRDDGIGMKMDDIEVLLQISKSSKKYSSINSCGRHTQGSKGLGFLSVFKFGDKVTWETNNGQSEIRLSVDYTKLEQLNELAEEEILVTESTPNDIKTYTEIRIKMSSEQNKEFQDFYNDKSNLNKILYSFAPEITDFNISVTLDRTTYNNSIPFDDILSTHVLEDKLLYNVTYDNSENIIKYFHNGIELFNEKYLMNISPNSLKLSLNLYIYSFQKNDTLKINPLFKFSELQNKIFPTVYINKNIFVSDRIFDPEITRSVKSSKSLPQMIGSVKIDIGNEIIEFNPQRTALVETTFTNNLMLELDKLNKLIQEKGAEKKALLLKNQNNKIIIGNLSDYSFIDSEEYDFDFIFQKIVNTKFKHTHLLSAKKIDDTDYEIYFANKMISTISLPPLKKNYYSQAKIQLKMSYHRIPINTQQINILDYVLSINNSKGELLKPHSTLTIYIDDIKASSHIIESQTKINKKIVRLEFTDNITGLCSQTLTLEFYEEKLDLKTPQKENSLINSPGNKIITISFSSYLNKLIEQINYLYKYKTTEKLNFLDIISMTLRTIYEISINEFIKEYKLSEQFDKIPSLESKIEKIISMIRSGSNKVVEKIAKINGLSYHTLNNTLFVDPDNKLTSYGSLLKKTNIYTHSGLKTIGTEDLENIGKNLSLFIAIINSCITEDTIKQILKNPNLINSIF